MLTRELAHRGHYPAIDVLQSVSRLAGEVTSPEARGAAQDLRAMMAAYRDKEDLISIGAYQAGTDPVVDAAVARRDEIAGFLCQNADERSTAEQADGDLLALVDGAIAPSPHRAAEDLVDAGLAGLGGLGADSPAPSPAGIPPLGLGL